jgi:hypothetical protein
MSTNENHYQHIEKVGVRFSDFLGLSYPVTHLLVSDGDKAYQYRYIFERNGLSFGDGVMIYLLSNISPYSKTVRQTDEGWVSVEEWLDKMCKNPTILDAITFANKND